MRKIAAPTLYLWLSSLSLFLALAGCVVPPAPYEDYALARAAVQAAQEADSARYVTAIYRRAEDSFRNGQKAFKDGDNLEAKKFFRSAIQLAEKAENMTKLKKFQSGDSFP